jgi:predicted RNase H-like nuclease (RuvC/YqgF family)
MSRNHQTQHREQPEERQNRKLVANLKQENQQLKRTVSRLQKEVCRLLDYVGAQEESQHTEETQTQVEGCPNCQKSLRVAQLGDAKIAVCANCGWRKLER